MRPPGPRLRSRFPQSSSDLNPALARNRQGPGDLPLRGAQAGRVVQLAGGVLKEQADQVAPGRLEVLDELRLGQVTQLDRLHPSSRMTNLVRTGSLWPASRMASRASG